MSAVPSYRHKAGRAFRAAATLGCPACAIPGCGYWHSVTHASFHVSLDFKEQSGEKPQHMLKAAVIFLGRTDKWLAQAVAAGDNHGDVPLLHPHVGDCHEVGKAATPGAWGNACQECFTALPPCRPTGARDVHQVEVVYNRVRF